MRLFTNDNTNGNSGSISVKIGSADQGKVVTSAYQLGKEIQAMVVL